MVEGVTGSKAISQAQFVPSNATSSQTEMKSSMSSMKQESSYLAKVFSCIARPLMAFWNWIRSWFVTEKKVAPVQPPVVKPVPAPAVPPEKHMDYNLALESETKRLMQGVAKYEDGPLILPYFEAYRKEHAELKNAMGKGSYDNWAAKAADWLLFSYGTKEELARMIQTNPFAMKLFRNPIRMIAQEFELKSAEYYFDRLGVTDKKDLQSATFKDKFKMWLNKCKDAKECETQSVESLAKALLVEEGPLASDLLEVNPTLKDKIEKAALKAIDLLVDVDELRVLEFKLDGVPELRLLKEAVTDAAEIVRYKLPAGVAWVADKYRNPSDMQNLVVRMVLKFEPQLAQTLIATKLVSKAL